MGPSSSGGTGALSISSLLGARDRRPYSRPGTAGFTARWQLPGLPRDFVLLRIAPYVPEPWLQGLVLFTKGFLVVMPGAGAVYSIFRRNQIRAPLIAAGILVPLIWLVLPWLRAALAAS